MYVTFKKRLQAFCFDYLLILAYIGLLIIVSFTFSDIQELFQGSMVTAQIMGFLFITFPVSLYFVIFDSKLVGQSWGKKKVGIVVINQDGGKLSIGQSLIRVILKFLPWEMSHFLIYRLANLESTSTPVYVYIIGGLIYVLIFTYTLTAIFSKRKQSLYDLICGTYVKEG